MEVQQLALGERKKLSVIPNSNIGKLDIGIRLFSHTMDIHTVVDIAVVCKSRTKGIYSIWYGKPNVDSFIYDETEHCNGSSWDDDDFRVSVDFSKIPNDIEKMSIVTNILWGKELSQHYGMIEDGYMRIYSHEIKANIMEQHIKWSNHKNKTGMIWAEIYSYKNDWKIRSIEESLISKDLGELVSR